MTKFLNFVFYAVFTAAAVIASVPPDVISLVPQKYRPVVVAVSGVAMWLKSHRNLFVNPDGTPAKTPWNSL